MIVQSLSISCASGRNSAHKDAVAGWLEWAGFRFDPFAFLDAALDPHLSEYLVGHEVFAQIWGDHISWVFAPAGGGKTALRISISRACWIGQETNRPFPVSYTPPFLSLGKASPSLDEHLSALARAAAITLFLATAYRPHWFFRLDGPERRELRNAFQQNLPGPLSYYLERCRQTGSADALRRVLDQSFILKDPPTSATLQEWCAALDGPHEPLSPLSPADRWQQLKTLLLDILEFPSLYILADGFDGAPETAENPFYVAECLAPLISCADKWAEERIFLKAFLPSDTRNVLAQQFPLTVTPDRISIMDWSPALLAEVIRRRVYVATEGTFGSLDAVSSPALRDVETILARRVAPPVPREMLVLTRLVLECHIRFHGTTGLIDERDVEAAIFTFNKHGRSKGEEVVASSPCF